MMMRLRKAIWVLGMGVAMPAYAQVSGIGLLQISPNSPGYRAQDEQGDTPLEKGAVVNPEVTFSEDQPITFEADEVGYDQQNAIVVARGNVQVVQGANILNAQQITYFQRSNFMKASGDVSILQPGGDIYFADAVSLQDGMKAGLIRNFRARLADNSVFAAEEARKVNQNVTELKNAAYTPCNLCEDAAPFWQMMASDVQIDEVDERVRYKNAHMEIMGVPLFYTPILSHPTPDADAKSGVLTPTYSTNGQLGTVVEVPYYWRIAPDKDITLTPWYTSEEGPLLEGDYRQLTDGGSYNFRFSGTLPDELDSNGNPTDGKEFRGHLYADGVESITDYSRVGFNIARSSDDTYLRRYGFGDQRVLFSRLYGEAAQDRNYAVVQGLSMQGLRSTDDADTTPLVLPTLEGYYETKPDDNGLRLHAFANAQSLTRNEGVNQHRLSMTTGASLPMVTDGGQVFTTTVNLRQDVYRVENLALNSGGIYDGTQLRTLPQAALEWRYPLIRSFGADAMTIEPIILAVAQTTNGNPQEISNEDNTLIELTDTNIFSLNRMPGLDTVDSGSRVAYGFRSQYLFSSGQAIDTMLGQVYNVDDDTPFPNSTDPGENASDIIGRVGFDYRPISLGYRFALDKSTLASNRNEFTAAYSSPGGYMIEGVYRSLDNNRYLTDSEEGILNASVPIFDEWTVYGGLRRDLTLDQMIASNLGLLYRNECFNLILQSMRTYTRDRDVEPNTSFTLRIGFKNLGEFGDN